MIMWCSPILAATYEASFFDQLRINQARENEASLLSFHLTHKQSDLRSFGTLVTYRQSVPSVLYDAMWAVYGGVPMVGWSSRRKSKVCSYYLINAADRQPLRLVPTEG